MHPKITGNPDILLKDSKTVVFLDGCFWHKCPKCFKKPQTNKKFWEQKINNNVKRDEKINKMLKQDGWSVIRFWQHDIRKDNIKACYNIIKEELSREND